jgi:alpha-tubulin suppressor-like RCC1 family protein
MILFHSLFRRNDLRAAVETFRRYAHACTWHTLWILKRDGKTIARIDTNRNDIHRTRSHRARWARQGTLFAREHKRAFAITAASRRSA